MNKPQYRIYPSDAPGQWYIKRKTGWFWRKAIRHSEYSSNLRVFHSRTHALDWIAKDFQEYLDAVNWAKLTKETVFEEVEPATLPAILKEVE